MGNSHGRENDGETFFLSHDRSLSDNLDREFVGRQARSREDGQLLSPHQGVEQVDGGNAGLNEIRRLVPGQRIYGGTHNICFDFRKGRGDSVDGNTGTGKCPAQHLPGQTDCGCPGKISHPRGFCIDTLRCFEQLCGGCVPGDLEDLSAAAAAIVCCQFEHLPEEGPGEHRHPYKRSGYSNKTPAQPIQKRVHCFPPFPVPPFDDRPGRRSPRSPRAPSGEHPVRNPGKIHPGAR